MNLKRRANKKGTVVYLGNGRSKPYAARISVGKDIDGKIIYYDINTFETQIDALVCLENWIKEPYPLKITKKRYDRIEIFTCFPNTNTPYPLVPVEDISSSINRKSKKYYTFKQLFEEIYEEFFPTKEEIKKELEEHIKPKNKYAYHNSRNLITAFNNSKGLYDKIYSELKTSDFKNYIKKSNKSPNAVKQMIQLYKAMDTYAFQEDIIDKCYAQVIKRPRIDSTSKRTPFSYKQIEYLWNIHSEDNKEELVRDLLLLAIYTGCRAEELCFIYTKNIHLEENYFIGGLKTTNGINREIPIHPRIKPIFEKYYDIKNEFLFMKANGKRLYYADYNNYYNDKFIDKHNLLKGKTAHCGRHGLETELKKLNIKPTVINAIIGHTNGNTGDDIYNHISIEEKLEAIRMVTFKPGRICVLADRRKTS